MAGQDGFYPGVHWFILVCDAGSPGIPTNPIVSTCLWNLSYQFLAPSLSPYKAAFRNKKPGPS